MPRQIAKIGDLFWIPIDDGSFVLGQVVEIKREVLNSITCAFYDIRTDDPKQKFPEPKNPISIQFVTKDLFVSGKWIRKGNKRVNVSRSQLPYRDTEENGWIGAKVIGSGIINKFLSAFYGLRSWDEMADPIYYEKLLLPGIKRTISA